MTGRERKENIRKNDIYIYLVIEVKLNQMMSFVFSTVLHVFYLPSVSYHIHIVNGSRFTDLKFGDYIIRQYATHVAMNVEVALKMNLVRCSEILGVFGRTYRTFVVESVTRSRRHVCRHRQQMAMTVRAGCQWI